MATQFKPVRFIVLITVAVFIVCGITAFYTHRAAHGRTAEERAAYWTGERAGEQAPRDAKSPTPADLNMIAESYFKQRESVSELRSPSRTAELQAWKQAFENGYEDGFKKTHQ